MANVRITPVQITDAGVTLVDAACTSADTYLISNDGRVAFEVNNAGGASADIVIQTLSGIGRFAVEDNTVAVAAGATQVIGPFSPSVYHPGTSDLKFTCSAALTVRAFRW